jgi:hypothetical protein
MSIRERLISTQSPLVNRSRPMRLAIRGALRVVRRPIVAASPTLITRVCYALLALSAVRLEYDTQSLPK